MSIVHTEAVEYPVAFTPPDTILVILGFVMVLTFMALIMTRRLTPMVALITVPTIFGLFAGAGLGLGDMVIDAIGDLAPTAALLMFAIMYFGIMIDVGLFDPLIRVITRLLGTTPPRWCSAPRSSPERSRSMGTGPPPSSSPPLRCCRSTSASA